MSDASALPNIDAIDREIIRLLQTDGRTPYSQLGRVVGLSDAAARQRVNRLTAEGYINIVAVTDPVKMGLQHQGLLGIRAVGDTRKVAVDVGSLDSAVYVVMTAGRYDLIAEIVTRDRESFVDVCNDVRLLAGVETIEVLPYLGITKETYDWGVG